MNDKREFLKLLQGVYEFYGKRDALTDFAAQVWWNACQSFEFEELSKAFSAHLVNAESGQYLPKPADIVRALQGTTTDRAAMAWGKVFEAMQSVGAYTDVVFDDPAIHAVIEDLGGWPKLCRGETKDIGYTMHRFCEFHKAYTGRREFQYTAIMRGDRSPDSEFKKAGLNPPAPKLVGNPQKAQEVMKGGSLTGKTLITDASQLLKLEGKGLITNLSTLG